MKRLLSLTMIAAVFALAIVACKDDFNEEEFLRLQSELKLKQDEVIRERIDSASEEAVKEYIAAMNEAGDLLAVSLIVRENGNAVPGVTVTLSTGTPAEISSGRAKAVTTGTTDASGNVVFDRVTIGSGTATFSKQGYVTATATYDFGTPDAPTAIQVNVPNGAGTVTKYVPPAKKFREAVVPMFSATPSEGSTATITGRVTIENDLTNLTPEVPTGIVLRANLTSLINNNNQGFFSSYVLADDNTLGRATIAADGTYTMVVPASASSTSINFIVPNIDGTSRMAVNEYDGVKLATPEYRDVPTSWGPAVTNDNNVPTVVGARVVLPPAPALGSGLSFDLIPVGRSLDAITISTSVPEAKVGSKLFYHIKNRGSFPAPIKPTVTITGGGGSGATAEAKIQALVTKIDVTNRGEGYPAQVNLKLVGNLQGGGSEDILLTNAINTEDTKLPETLNLADIDGVGGVAFGSDDTPLEVVKDYASYSVVVVGGAPTTQAVLSPTFVIDLKSVEIKTEGTGYTSAPTFDIGNGAVFEIIQFPVFWYVNPAMGAGTDYAILPDFKIQYPQGGHDQQASTEVNIDTFFPNGISDAIGTPLRGQLTISSGDVVKKNHRIFRTTKRSHDKPSVTIITETPQNARLVFGSGAINPTTGAITSVPLLPVAADAGNGYNFPITAQIVPSATGAPGSGASIQLNYDTDGVGNNDDYDPVSLEWQFEHTTTINGNPNNVTITAQGSGYLPNLNQYSIPSPTPLPTAVSVQAGKTYTVNFAYEHGKRSVKVN